jgi:hypothetical protein
VRSPPRYKNKHSWHSFCCLADLTSPWCGPRRGGGRGVRSL